MGGAGKSVAVYHFQKGSGSGFAQPFYGGYELTRMDDSGGLIF